MFNLLEGDFQEEKDSSKEELKHIQGISKFDLSLTALDLGSELHLSFEYNTKLFNPETIERFINYFRQLIQSLSINQEQKIKNLNIIPEAEKHRLLYKFNDTKRDYPKDKTIHQLFEEQAERIPEHVALIYNDQIITYRELNSKSNQLAYILKEKGFKTEKIAGIIVDRSIEMLIGILGILKSGGAYLPLDPSYPDSRINYILENSKSQLILCSEKYRDKIDLSFRPFILEEGLFTKGYTSNLDISIKTTELCYVIYTSGSTGTPKGVNVEHLSVLNLLYFLQDKYPIRGNDSYLLKTSYCFDVSISEIFGWIHGGGKLCILEAGHEKDAVKIIETINKSFVTHINFVPTVFNSFSDYISEFKKDKLISLKYILLAGEALLREHLKTFKSYGLDIQINNLYGPTEATVYASYYSVDLDEIGSISIGKPISNYEIYILDKNLELQPVGVSGELLIGGKGLARDYLNNTELTTEKFIDHPFKEGEKLYKTGDLARWLPDGNIEFLGRIDHQVKIRGFRIELGEIENVLLRHKNIKESVVLVRRQGEDKYLCAYIVVEEAFNKEEIRNYISEHLPNYMIPSYFVELENIPLSSKGKIDSKSLPTPKIKAGASYEAPKTLIENKLVKIWSEVLKISSKEISANVSFFELGGHSLKATVLVSRIHKELNVRLELRDIFQYQTIQAQSELINSSENSIYLSIPKAKEQDNYTLSSSQHRLYLLQQMDLGSTAYNIPGLLTVPKGQNKQQIEEVFNKLITRHENFRTSFGFEDEIPVQRIHSEVVFSIREYRITKSELSNIKEDFVKAFDLSQAPLLRVGYLEISDGDNMLLIDMHHIISDGKSHSILKEEFEKLIAKKELEPLRLQYKDYSEWQNSEEQQERIKGQEEYWLNKFTGELPVLELPSDYSRPAIQSFEGASVGFILSPEETKIIHDLCKDQGLTLYMSLLSIFTILLSKLSGQEDIIVGSPIAARRYSDLEDIVGMFVNTLAIRSEVSGDKRLIDYLQELKQNTLEAYENQEYQFEDLVEKLVVNRDTSRNPIFDVMFNLLEGESQKNSNSSQEELIHSSGISKFDLSLTALDLGSELELSFEYSTKLFNSKTIERFINYFRQLIQSILGNQEQKIRDLTILQEEEKQQLLYEFNDTKIDYPKDKTIHQLFEEQVERTPYKVAIIFGEQQLTYLELNDRSNKIANFLFKSGVLNDSIIGILISRSIDQYLAILGILKTGKAYLPLDYLLPEIRIKNMLADSNVNIILGNGDNKLNGFWNGKFININSKLIKKEPSDYVKDLIEPSSLAYIIYTSGSTGIPKGVLVNHNGVINLISSQNKDLNLASDELILQFSNLVFDASVEQIWLALLKGNTLLVVDNSTLHDISGMPNLINKFGTTHINSVPTYLNGLDVSSLKSVRRIISGGESCNVSIAEKLLSKPLYNQYGLTETTVTALKALITYLDVEKDTIPIGSPLDNTDVYILDKWNKLKPIGVCGELCISGAGLARGYLNNPELTSEKFIEHPYKEGEHLYKTGDLARWLPDGNIEFIGRIDHQVKIRGFRIELGEIENILLKLTGIQECVVLAREDQGDKYLCAYVVSDKEKDNEELRTYLSGLLPDYMIPSYFVELEELPLTNSGKVNRKALPTPEIKAGGSYVAPSTLIESKLVKIWSEVLNIPSKEISTSAIFFELGGHSLKVTVLVSRIHKELNVQLGLRDIFQYQSIQGQSKLIASSDTASYFSIPKAKKQAFYPLSSSQRRLYLLQQMDLENTAYNMPGTLEVPCDCTKEQITTVFDKLVARHENFRTSFEIENELPVQRIHTDVSLSISNHRIRSEELSDLQKDFIQAFDLSKAPLLRVGYLEVLDGEDLLLIDMHHIISDGESHRILQEEFNNLLSGKDLPELDLHYKDYSEWQNSEYQQKKIQDQEYYWLEKYKEEVPVLELPTDNIRPVMQSFEGAGVSFVLSPDDTQIIQNICKEQGLTMYMSLLSIFTILLSKLSGQEDIIVGSPIAARRHSDLERIVGMFINTLALRNEVSGDKRLVDYLQELKESTLEAYENQEYQFEDIVEQVVTNRDTSRNPLFDVMFNLLNQTDYSGDLSVFNNEDYVHSSGISKFDLTMTVADYGEQLLFNLQYSTKLFKSETIDRFIHYFKQIINQLPYKLEDKLSTLEIITESEKQQLLYDFNDTKRDYSRDKTIHQLFEEQVERTLLKNALIFEQEGLSYYDLNQKSNQIAHYLRNNGVTRNSVVVLIFEPSHEMIICLLGVLKSGACYLPINPELPNDRISYMLSDSESSLILTNNFSYNENPFNINLIHINDNFFNKESGNLECINTVADPIYVIYTSGTTGKPKGVILKHENLINYTSWFNSFKQLGHEEKTVLTTSYSFDLGYTSIYSSLVNGYELHLLPKELYLSTRDFNRYIIDNKISYLKTTPSLYSSMVDCDLFAMAIKNLKLLLLGGESINTYVVEKTISLNEDIQIINHYGPTEATIGCITYSISKENLNSFLDRPVIGNPIHNTNAYIVDESVNLLPIGVAGELCISGEGLAQGYLNNLFLTDEKFISHPFKNGEKLYRTGDLARWLPEGNIEFLGRIDNQVKIRGYRIELEEISNVLKAHENIEECVVLAREENRDKYLCAYLVTEEDLKEEELRTYLSASLPDYMLPSYFVELAEMPLTSNGKVNRKALPSPEVKAGDNYVASSNKTEETLLEIWSEVLKIPKKEISVIANFFSIGGHSLKANILITKINWFFETDLSLKEIFRSSSIQKLSKVIEKTSKVKKTIINISEKKEYYKLSSSQKRIFLVQQLNLKSLLFSLPSLYPLDERHDKDRIERAFNQLIERHDGLRTSFKFINNIPVQIIADKINVKIESVKISFNQLESFYKDFIRPFDLTKSPLLRAVIVNIDEKHYYLMIDMHHTISDGVSLMILQDEFLSLLNDERLNGLKLQYKDYSEWVNSPQYLSSIERQREFWIKELVTKKITKLNLISKKVISASKKTQYF